MGIGDPVEIIDAELPVEELPTPLPDPACEPAAVRGGCEIDWVERAACGATAVQEQPDGRREDRWIPGSHRESE
jgi:hypothetical protein